MCKFQHPAGNYTMTNFQFEYDERDWKSDEDDRIESM